MRSPIRLAVVGAAGRMGAAIADEVTRDPDFAIAAALEAAGHPRIGSPLDGHPSVRIEGALAEAFARCDVIVDLSTIAATADVANAAAVARRPLICGTTGLGEPQKKALLAAAATVPVLESPNLSLAVAVMGALVEKAAAALGPDYDIEIVEMHHRHKRDAPSGTALSLARSAMQGRAIRSQDALVFGRSGQTERGSEEIGVHAVRAGGVFGEHTAVLAGEHERLEITHRASSRALFARGALYAAKSLRERAPGLYTMADILPV